MCMVNKIDEIVKLYASRERVIPPSSTFGFAEAQSTAEKTKRAFTSPPLPRKNFDFLHSFMRYKCKLWAYKTSDMNRIKEVLEQKGIKQTWLAEKLGKSYNMVNAYAQNRQQPRLETLMKIANILDVDVKELIISNKEK